MNCGNLICRPIFEQVSPSLITGVGDGVGVGSVGFVEVGVGVAEGDCAAVDLIKTPLFQTNFFPDLTQVYFIFETVLVVFTFVHLVPVRGADAAGMKVVKNIAVIMDAASVALFRGIERC